MDKHTNIAIYSISKSAIRLNIYNLLINNLLLNSKNKKDNRGTNKNNYNILFEKNLSECVDIFQFNTQDLPIPINLNFNSTLLSLNPITT